MNEKEKEKLAKETIESFFNKFKNFDIYSKIVLEEVFRKIYDTKKNIYIQSKKRQK